MRKVIVSRMLSSMGKLHDHSVESLGRHATHGLECHGSSCWNHLEAGNFTLIQSIVVQEITVDLVTLLVDLDHSG